MLVQTDLDSASVASGLPGAWTVEALASLDGPEALRLAITGRVVGRLAVVSSFGADSALLLSLVADIDRTVPVLFLETGRHFPETLAYRRQLAAHLGLTDVRDIHPAADEAAAEDPDGDLWLAADQCCALRKTRPLERALAPFDAWVTGRRRHQAATRAVLPVVEREAGRIKLNPLADWDASRIDAEFRARGLPRHPLRQQGYLSIGCAPCTRPVRPGEDPRSGRWAGRGKIECGIHRPSDAHLFSDREASL
jgi:phosphoadenosine phosphosulfate reductase